LLVLTAFTAWTQAAEPATPVVLSTPGPKKNVKKPTPQSSPSPELENVRRALDALSPEQRRQFRENLIKWMNLPPDDKKALRDAQEARKKHMQEEIEDALKSTGLELDPQRRQAFVKRYSEERKRIEENLRKETEEKRAPRLEELRQRLKTEFGAPGTPAKATP
jgi:hypothetical protein